MTIFPSDLVSAVAHPECTAEDLFKGRRLDIEVRMVAVMTDTDLVGSAVQLRFDARKLAKRVSWRTLFLEAYTREAANGASQWIFSNSVNLTDKLKGIEL